MSNALQLDDVNLFTDETSAALVVGRRGSAKVSVLRDRSTLLQSLSERTGVQFTVVAQADLSADDDDDQKVTFVLGILIASNRAIEPVEFDFAAIEQATLRLSALGGDVWESAIAAGFKVYNDDDDDRMLRPWLVAFGPLANAWVAYALPEPKGELKTIRGIDMSQEPQEKAVYGVVIQSSSYEDSPDFMDVDADQKAELESDVGTPEEGARFWLIAKYD